MPGQCSGAHVSLLTPGKTNYSDCHQIKITTYILHEVSISRHTHDRRKSIGENEQRKEKKMKERKEKKRRKRNKTKKARKEKKRQEKQEKTRHE